MRYALAIIILTLFSGTLPAQVAFQKIVQVDNANYPYSIVPADDGGYLMTGILNLGLGVIKLNSAGDTIWSRGWHTGFSSFAYEVATLPDGRLAVAGDIGYLPFGPGIVVFDSTHQVDWAQMYEGQLPNLCYGLIPTSDNGVAALYSATGIGAAGSGCGGWCEDMMVVKTTSDGDTLWTCILGRPDMNDRAAGIVELADGGLAVVGQGRSPEWDAILARIDANGDTVFVKRYVSSATALQPQFYSIAATPDGGYVIGGSVGLPFPGNRNLLITKLDPMLNVVWHKSYDVDTSEEVLNLAVAPNGDIYAAGELETNGTGLIARLNSDGDMLWAWKLVAPDRHFESVAATADGGAIIAGWTQELTADDWYITRVDSSGAVPCPSDFDSLTWTTTTVQLDVEYGLELNRGTEIFPFEVTHIPPGITMHELCDTCFGPPIANINATTYLLEAAFEDVSEGSTDRTWYFPDGDSATTALAHRSFDSAGTYQVCLVARNECGADTICDSLTVVCSEPVAGFDWEVDTHTVAFLDQSDYAQQWDWDFGDGNTDSGPFPVHDYQQNGSYVVCLQASNYCGTSNHCDTISVSFVGLVDTPNRPCSGPVPNPSNGRFTVRCPSNQHSTYFTIFDLAGKVVQTVHLPPGSSELNVALPAGLYLLEAKRSGQRWTKKLFITNK